MDYKNKYLKYKKKYIRLKQLEGGSLYNDVYSLFNNKPFKINGNKHESLLKKIYIMIEQKNIVLTTTEIDLINQKKSIFDTFTKNITEIIDKFYEENKLLYLENMIEQNIKSEMSLIESKIFPKEKNLFYNALFNYIVNKTNFDVIITEFKKYQNQIKTNETVYKFIMLAFIEHVIKSSDKDEIEVIKSYFAITPTEPS
jgi:hypothetical protein